MCVHNFLIMLVSEKDNWIVKVYKRGDATLEFGILQI